MKKQKVNKVKIEILEDGLDGGVLNPALLSIR